MAPVGAYIEEIEARILGQEQMMVRFCQGCDYSNSHEACPYPIKAKAVIHDECDWSMMQGVGTPRTNSTFKIWDPSQRRDVTIQRSKHHSVEAVMARSLADKARS